MLIVPGSWVSFPANLTVIRVGLATVAFRATPFTSTFAFGRNAVPSMTRVKAPPGQTVLGFKDVIVGTLCTTMTCCEVLELTFPREPLSTRLTA